MEKARRKFSISFPTKGRTHQSFKDECDINLIVARARNSVSIPINARVPRFLDCASIPDYRSALDTVRSAEQMFEGLSSEIRERFSNDPARLLDFLSDEKNRDEAVRLGLLNPKPEPAVQSATDESVAPSGKV